MIFVDSSAWFAASVPDDDNYPAAIKWLEANSDQSLITTDYVIDETLTLLRCRGQAPRALTLGQRVFEDGDLTSLHFVSPEEIAAAWDIFRRFADKQWSFTDCVSRVVMERLGITQAFAFDEHFRQFGTVVVVPS